MSRRRRSYGRPRAGVVINADRVIIPSAPEEPPPGPTTSLKDVLFGVLAGMLILRLIDLGQVFVLK